MKSDRELLYLQFLRLLKEKSLYGLFVKNYNTKPFFWYDKKRHDKERAGGKISLKEWFNLVDEDRLHNSVNDAFYWPEKEYDIWLDLHHVWVGYISKRNTSPKIYFKKLFKKLLT